MKKFFVKIFAVVLATFCGVPCFATDNYGADETACDVRYFVTSGTVPVHSSNSADAPVVQTVKAGDYIYVDTDSLYYNGEEAWVKISGEDKYILSYRLTIEDNPKFVPADTGEVLESKESVFKFGFYGIPKWLGITLLCVWLLLVLYLSIDWFADDDGLGMFPLNLKWFPPSKNPRTMYELNKIKDFESSSRFEEYGYGMSKIFFFTGEPYGMVITLAGIIFGTFVATIILCLLVGCALSLGSWLLMILMCALYLIFLFGLGLGGVALGITSLVSIYDSSDLGAGWRLGIFVFWIPIRIAFWVGGFWDDVFDLAGVMTGWGTNIFTTFNVFGVSLFIIKTYWLTALIISLFPLALFLAAALLFGLFASALMLYENIKMKRYNIKHPCPHCQQQSEPAVYFDEGIPLHVPLKPSPWGLFSITHPKTGKRMPTLFANGKDRLMRRCPHCDGIIKAYIGVEKHVAAVGVPGSGKTTLLYRIISELVDGRTVGGQHIYRFTDSLGDDEYTTKAFLGGIAGGKKMDLYPEKTPEGRHQSIQLLGYNPSDPYPYRLYINDVAGEVFTAANNEYNDVPFFKNTNVLIFVLDPFTLNAKSLDFSPEFAEWYRQNVGDKNNMDGKFNLADADNTLFEMMNKFRKDDYSGIKLMFTFVKTDAKADGGKGYLDDCLAGVSSNDENYGKLLETFACKDMGLESLIFNLKKSGMQVSFHAVSASDASSDSNISEYIDTMLGKLDISQKNLQESKIEKSWKKHERRVKKEMGSHLSVQKVNEFVASTAVFWVIFALALESLFMVATVRSLIRTQNQNYAETLALVRTESGKPLNYDGVMSVIKTSVAEKILDDTQKEDLTKKYLSADREKRKHISRLRSILYANFESKGGRMSNFEMALKYNAFDTVKNVRQYFEEFGALAPDDAQYIMYYKQFKKLLTKYNVQI